MSLIKGGWYLQSEREKSALVRRETISTLREMTDVLISILSFCDSREEMER